MSLITHLMLHISSLDQEARLNEINRFFEGYPPNSIDDLGNTDGKPWVASVYIGAYNFFDLDGFIAHLQSIAWEFPDYVQLMVRTEGERGFRVALEIDMSSPQFGVNRLPLPTRSLLSR